MTRITLRARATFYLSTLAFIGLLMTSLTALANNPFAPLPQDSNAPTSQAPGDASNRLFSAQAPAQSDLLRPAKTGAALFNEATFLPVDEAYQFSAAIHEGVLELRFTIAPNYYLYRERFSITQAGERLSVDYSDAILKYDELFERETLLHFDQALLRIPISRIKPDTDLRVGYQGCAEAGLCYPPEIRTLRIDLDAQQVSVAAAPTAPVDAASSAGSRLSDDTSLTLFSAALLAMLGGILLNLMPCVFPVLSIKALQLTQQDAARLPAHGLAYTAGVIATFMLLAGVLVALKTSGAMLGWGFQFQSPSVTAGLFLLFIVLGLGLSGVINMGSQLMGAGDKLTRGAGLNASFFTGALAVVVASPCTAPLMGAAVGFALAQSTAVTLAVFAALGFGMALPMLALCLFPRWQQWLPRPGGWMETLKEALAFPLYLSAIWLLWVFGRQTDMSSAAMLLCAALTLVFCAWLSGRVQIPSAKWVIALGGLVVAVSAVLTAKTPPQTDALWQPYSAASLSDYRAQGRPVLVNMTADWCITCLANEKTVLHLDSTQAALKAANVVAIKGDWTNSNPEITQFLRDYGRSGVPLYVWFPANHVGDGIILPQILTQATLFEVLEIDNQDK